MKKKNKGKKNNLKFKGSIAHHMD